MKRQLDWILPSALIVLVAIVGLSNPRQAGAWTETRSWDLPISTYSAPVTVSVATGVYTNVTSSATRIFDLSAIMIVNLSTSSNAMHGHVGNCTSTDVSTHTIKGPIVLFANGGTSAISIARDNCLWLVSHSIQSPENVVVQGFGQAGR